MPEIVTDVPAAPLVGVKPEIVGSPITRVKFVALETEPPYVAIVIGPVVAPAGKYPYATVDELIPYPSADGTPLN